MHKIENKAYLKPKPPTVVDKPPKEEKEAKIGSNEEIQLDFRRLGDSTLKKLHPKLAEHYDNLNEAIFKLHTLGPRTQEFKRKYTNEVEHYRKKVQEYKKNEGITREDEIRWLNGD